MKKNNEVIKGLIMISQIGLTMLAPIFLCIFIGYQLDRKFNTGFWFIVFLILGFMTAFRNVYVLTKQFYAKDKAREDANLRYLESLKRERKQGETMPPCNTESEAETKNNIAKGRLS